jgi:hypothetical protein
MGDPLVVWVKDLFGSQRFGKLPAKKVGISECRIIRVLERELSYTLKIFGRRGENSALYYQRAGS